MEKLQIVPDVFQEYAEKYSTPEDDLLQEIASFTNKNHAHAIMLSGHLQGKYLQMVSQMINPLRVLEIGTFTGYSGLCLAAGLQPQGLLHTIELREEDANIAQAYFNRSVYKDKIILHTGNALDIIAGLQETWDLVFIDADKTGYKQYFDLVFPKLRKNGFILADNVFFHGQVLEENPKNKSATAIKEFNDYIKGRQDVDKMMLTLRDGLYIIRKN